jgi:hypothetical protein
MVKRHRRQNAGGMPLSFLDSSYKEPSASAGSNHNISEVGLARPVLNHTGGSRRKVTRKNRSTKKKRSTRSCRTCKKVGGFYPSVMGSLVRNAQALIPAAGITGYRMWNNFGKTKKNRY